MKLIKFRVKNFRSVEDSGWIDLDNVTAFVGVNESGKTNLLLPLWKLNPAKEGGIEPTADYPKNMYSDIRKNPEGYKFIEAVFYLDEDAKKIASLTGYSEAEINEVHLWKNFAGKFQWDFPNAIPPRSIPDGETRKVLSDLKASVSASNELASESGLKDRVAQEIDAAMSLLKAEITRDESDSLLAKMKSLHVAEHAKTSVIHPRISQSIEQLVKINAPFHRKRPWDFEGVWDEFKKRLPVFLYYSNYGNLDSEIYLPHVVENLTREGLGLKEAAKARTLRVLFSFVGLNPQEILELG